MAISQTYSDFGGFGFPGFFKSGPCQGRQQAPPLVATLTKNGIQSNNSLDVDLGLTLVLWPDKKSPTTTLNKRSLWESLFRPRSRPSKCAIPYFKAPNFFNFYCKLTPNWRPKCTPPYASAVACCTVPTTPANPKGAPKRLLATLNRDGAFAATCAVSVQRRCR